MKTLKIVVMLFGVFLAQACEQTINVDLPDYVEQIAVECLIEQELGLIGLTLGRSEDAFGYTEDLEEFIPIDNAIVEVTVDGLTQQCQLLNVSTNSEISIYACLEFPELCTDCPISLRIESEGEVATASSRIPKKVAIESVEVTEESFSFFGEEFDGLVATANFNDPPGAENFYVLSWSSSVDENSLSDQPTDQGVLFISDKGRDGEKIEIRAELNIPVFNYGGFEESIYFNFFLESLSESAFDYLASRQLQENFDIGLFAEPTPINGNIQNGLGVFGARVLSEPFFKEVEL